VNKATTKKILYVDDDSDDHIFLSQFLASSNVNTLVIDAYDGDEAIRYLNAADDASLPSLIVLDLNMPKRNGYEVLKYLKTSRFSDIPVVILSTSNNEKDKELSNRLGAASYLQKPFHYQGYREVINQFMALLPLAR
jgi:CheY-like chemotaxis protein